jgi:hypothetical protein
MMLNRNFRKLLIAALVVAVLVGILVDAGMGFQDRGRGGKESLPPSLSLPIAPSSLTTCPSGGYVSAFPCNWEAVYIAHLDALIPPVSDYLIEHGIEYVYWQSDSYGVYTAVVGSDALDQTGIYVGQGLSLNEAVQRLAESHRARWLRDSTIPFEG